MRNVLRILAVAAVCILFLSNPLSERPFLEVLSDNKEHITSTVVATIAFAVLCAMALCIGVALSGVPLSATIHFLIRSR